MEKTTTGGNCVLVEFTVDASSPEAAVEAASALPLESGTILKDSWENSTILPPRAIVYPDGYSGESFTLIFDRGKWAAGP